MHVCVCVCERNWKTRINVLNYSSCLYESTRNFNLINYYFYLDSLWFFSSIWTYWQFKFLALNSLLEKNIHIPNPWKSSGDPSVHRDDICQDIYQQNSIFFSPFAKMHKIILGPTTQRGSQLLKQKHKISNSFAFVDSCHMNHNNMRWRFSFATKFLKISLIRKERK